MCVRVLSCVYFESDREVPSHLITALKLSFIIHGPPFELRKNWKAGSNGVDTIRY